MRWMGWKSMWRVRSSANWSVLRNEKYFPLLYLKRRKALRRLVVMVKRRGALGRVVGVSGVVGVRRQSGHHLEIYLGKFASKLVVGGVTCPPQASWNPPSSMLTSPASLGPWWSDYLILINVTWMLIPLMATPMAAPRSLAAPTFKVIEVSYLMHRWHLKSSETPGWMISKVQYFSQIWSGSGPLTFEMTLILNSSHCKIKNFWKSDVCILIQFKEGTVEKDPMDQSDISYDQTLLWHLTSDISND